MSNKTLRPMLFRTEMVQAILSGRKTQTRRILKFKTESANTSAEFKELQINSKNNLLAKFCQKEKWVGWFNEKCPVNVGDVIWVRETFRGIEQDFGKPRYEYKATEKINKVDKWKPSLFMPKDACRLFLEITSVKVEKLKDISERDAIKEGIYFTDYGRHCFHMGIEDIDKCPADEKTHPIENGWFYKETKSSGGCLGSAQSAFANLWQSINGSESWDNNPWLWVYEFKIVDCPEGFR